MLINIAFSSDDNYAKYLAAALLSLLKTKNKKSVYNIYILGNNLSLSNQQLIISSIKKYKKFSIHFISVDLKNLNVTQFLHLSSSTYSRIFVPSLIPKNIHKIIYLDCDLLFLEDISTLFDTEMDNYYLAAVPLFHPNYGKALKIIHRNINDTYQIFNAGVLVMNLDLLRKNKFTEKMKKKIKAENQFYFAADQDALISMYGNKTKELNWKWNVTSYLYLAKNPEEFSLTDHEFVKLLANPSIIHFDGVKPWQSGYQHPYANQFKQSFMQTEFWKDWPSFNLFSYIKNTIFFVGIKVINVLPNRIYQKIINIYFKNNFISKRYKSFLNS